MTKIPEPTITIAKLVDAAHELRAEDEKRRGHMGCSMLGHDCDRWLWLSFRWATKITFPGRMLRLFRRGQNEEETVVNDLRMTGCEIQYTGKTQKRADFGSHVSGSMDGIINSGVLGAEKTPHVLEIKTHKLSSFNDLEKHGVQKSKPQHWAQMQVYMYGTGLDRALYYAVCKDDDRLHTERIRLNKSAAIALVERGKRIALSERIPEPMPGASPDWYLCKFCKGYQFCHETNLTTEVNCRTCAHSTPNTDGTWTCAHYDGSVIAEEYQEQGCESHVLHPDLVPWQRLPSPSEHEAVYLIDNVEVRNGEPCKNVWSSKEILAKTSEVVDPSPVVEILRDKFDARIIDIDDEKVPF